MKQVMRLKEALISSIPAGTQMRSMSCMTTWSPQTIPDPAPGAEVCWWRVQAPGTHLLLGNFLPCCWCEAKHQSNSLTARSKQRVGGAFQKYHSSSWWAEQCEEGQHKGQ